MLISTLVQRLGRNDAKVIGRDRFLLFMFLFALYIAVSMRYVLPWLNNHLADRGIMPGETIPISLSEAYPMLVAFLVIFSGAQLVGAIFGFILLDERDQNTLRAMMVTPVPLNHYVLYRVCGPAILAFLIILGMALIVDQALLPWWQMALISLGGSLTAPIVSLFFATFAANKVEGFAYSKFGGVAGWTILVGYFVAEPWQWLIGLFPPFWISKAYWMALEGSSWWWLALIAGVLLQLGLIRWLVERFERVAHR